ncbi:MAG: hypothetical protein KDI62_06625 [Anaerolineae bacterium]|nr:hypothetical protein [Anaerolineae bacterium]
MTQLSDIMVSWQLLKARLKNSLSKNPPIIIYQMGKVGSKSVVTSVRKHYRNVYHVHRMNPLHINRIQTEAADYRHLQLNDHIGLWLYSTVVRKRKVAKFITLVREPIARNISAFFENMACSIKRNSRPDIDQLIDTFLKQYPHSVPLTWFDLEMKQTLEIDIYQYRFPKDLGFFHLKNGDHEVLVMKSELDDSVKAECIADFLGVDDFQLIKENVGQSKSYGSIYQQFLKNILLPEDYITKMYNSKYAQHFYTAQEIQQARFKWSKGLNQALSPDNTFGYGTQGLGL